MTNLVLKVFSPNSAENIYTHNKTHILLDEKKILLTDYTTNTERVCECDLTFCVFLRARKWNGYSCSLMLSATDVVSSSCLRAPKIYWYFYLVILAGVWPGIFSLNHSYLWLLLSHQTYCVYACICGNIFIYKDFEVNRLWEPPLRCETAYYTHILFYVSNKSDNLDNYFRPLLFVRLGWRHVITFYYLFIYYTPKYP